MLKKSKIFLSFSSFEGLGLPPAEAALLGNFVIGSTVEGGNEYCTNPIFTKITSVENVTLVKKVLKKIKRFKNDQFPLQKYTQLKDKFSKEKEIRNIQKFLKLI